MPVFNSSLPRRPVSASLYTGDLGRKARQPRGGPKGAGSDWSEAASCTFWQLPGSARLRPLCALLPVLPACLPCYAIQPHSFLFSLSLSPRLLLEVRAQVCSIFLPLPGGGGVCPLRELGGSKICCQKDLAHTEIHPASFSSFGS